MEGKFIYCVGYCGVPNYSIYELKSSYNAYIRFMNQKFI